MKKFLFIPALCILCMACNSNSGNRNEHANHDSDETSEMQSEPSDWDITANVKKTLMTDSTLSSKARMISVTTNNGVVTLTGTVASKEEGRKVVRMVKGVPGVTDVDNQLTVSNN